VPTRPPDDGYAAQAARAVRDAFVTFETEFLAITGRARARFESRDWGGNNRDAAERLDLYAKVMSSLHLRVSSLLGPRTSEPGLWRHMKRAYVERIDGLDNAELARTFYNSLTRKIFSTVGVRPDIEFLSEESVVDDTEPDPAIYRRYERNGTTHELIRGILADYALEAPYRDVDGDAQQIAEAIERYLASRGPTPIDAVEVLRSVFYRHKSAFLIGRIISGKLVVPLVLPLCHDAHGVTVDAVLMTHDAISILFSFTRAHFHVDTVCPSKLIVFLRSIMPIKPVAELYIALGFHKHGKTELYRDLQRYLGQSTDRFETAEGDRGMVMLVFTLRHYDVVFKIIRDEFDRPKQSTRRDVMDRYRLVFKHDRVGRLVDAQEFEHLEFRKSLFSEELLEELQRDAANSVRVEGDRVVISHLYTERKVSPLNLYLRQANEGAARQVVIDYGNSIKELAAANIFPGDFLLKNFGVTRHGRVVFYDYDELCRITDCNFRRIPPARSPEEELDPEPWFNVGPDDIFPEEFERFLGLPAPLREVFVRHHAELFRAEYWKGLQERLERGEIMDFFAYGQEWRLKRGVD